MKLTIPLLLLTLFATSCQQPVKTDKAERQRNDTSAISVKTADVVKTQAAKNASQWFDSLSIVYNKATNNKLVRQAVDDNTITEEWLFDQEIKTDTANYYVYQVGHDVTDAHAKRFITDSWIYVDTLKRKFYEFEVVDSKLLEWKP